MRKAAIFGTLAVVLGAIFYLIVLRSPTQLDVAELAPRSATRKVVPATIPALDPSMPVGRSNDVWAQSIDPRTQRVINEFSSEDVSPRPDGTVDVIRPRARFYGRNKGVVLVEGSSGHMLYTQAGQRGDAKALGTSTPTSGELREVTIKFFDRTLDEEPSFVVTVPAVRFDANSNRISTVDCVVNGQGYAAEQVPVTVRGRDFDFDGQGLSIAWNDREEMLDQLEILKGDRLVVHDISKYVGQRVVSADRRDGRLHRPLPAPSLATAMFGIVAVQAPATQGNLKDLYYATFDRDVHIVKGGQEVASGDQMRCVIPLGQSASRHDSDEPSTKRASTQGATTHAAAHPSGKGDGPTTAPATQPQSLEIRWSGKLLIRPVRLVQEAAGTQMVELVGNPAKVTDKGASATGRVIRVEPDAGRVRIEPGGNVRAIEVRDAAGAELRSRSPLTIDQTLGSASIDGGGALNVPPGVDQKGPLQLTWSKKLNLSLSNKEPSHLQDILIEGDAKVDSSNLKLNCATLSLSFGAPASPADSPNDSRFSMPSPDLALLQKVHARGDASFTVGEEGEARTLSAQDIQLGFIAGEKDALLNSIACDGQVTLVDGEALNLNAGALSVRTKPLSLSNGEVQTADDFFTLVTAMSATKGVKISRIDGTSVEGDRLDLSGEGASQRLVANGAPAVLRSAKGSLNGDRIELDPATGDIYVPSAGSFAGANPDKPGADVSVGWEEAMKLNGKTGECDFTGAVRISGHDEKGSELLAHAKRGQAQFAMASDSTKPAEPGLAGIRFESLHTLTLDGGVNLAISTTDSRSSSMETERLEIDLSSGTLRAPQAGRMLVVDQRKNPETGKNAFGPGALAMLWKNELNWNMRGGMLELVGGVRVGFEREGSNDPVRITCNRLTGALTPLEPGSGFDQMTPRIDLRQLTADGNVVVTSKSASFDAAQLVYDLQTQLVTAHGTEAKPVEVLDKDGSSRIGFSTISWNLQTGQMDSRDFTGQLRR